MEIKRISKFSNIIPVRLNDESVDIFHNHLMKAIQIIESDKNPIIYIEYIPEAFLKEYMEEQSTIKLDAVQPVKNQEEESIEDDLNTVLNKDPRNKYSGKTLKEIFDANDMEWLHWALSNMKNEFIRKKLEKLYKLKYN